MTAQIEVLGIGDGVAAKARLEADVDALLALAQAALPRLVERGGGARAIEVRTLPGRVILHVHIDCRDAMGANMVNTVAEALADRAAVRGGRPPRAADPDQPVRPPLRSGQRAGAGRGARDVDDGRRNGA